MDERRWSRIRDIFHEALDLDPDARSELLRKRCSGDDGLLEEIEGLLSSAPEADAWLAGLATRVGARVSDPPRDLSGTRIGRYRILRSLGHGGMGAVYLAERADEQFEKTVALKLLPMGMAGPDDHRLFLRERQVLARLEHPGIARLLDGGVTDDGTPYFVMEYVRGTPIVEYCETHALSVGDRLALFRQVCDAVEYAHRNLVIHRDLKSENILVTETGEGKLLDFGIARVLEEHERGRDTATARGGVRLTPGSASPEQMRNEPVDTTTDVYSLGVVLYRLLAGRPPYHIPTDASPARIERIVCEQVPEPPARSRPGVHADLDSIVLTALRKEPSERYQSVRDLAADVERHLRELPVLARKDDRWYRASRFVRRNRLVVAGGSVLTLLLLAIAGLSVLYSVRTAEQAAAVQEQRDVARHEAARAERVTELLVDLFEGFDPAEERGDTLTAGALLRRGMERVAGLPGEPDLRADLLDAMGQAYLNLGLLSDAETALADAVGVRRRLGGSADARKRLAVSLHALAVVRSHAQAFAEADTLWREALDIQEELRAAEPNDTSLILSCAATMLGHAAALRNLGRPDSAAALMREVIDTRSRYQGAGHPATLVAMATLAYALRGTGDLDGAETLYRDVADRQRTLGGSARLELAKTLNDLAYLLRTRGDYDGAEPLYRESLAIVSERVGEAHPTTLMVMNNLASVLSHRGDMEAAEEILRQRVALEREHRPPGHWRIGAAWGALGTHLVRFAGDPAAALEPMRERLAVYRSALGDDHDWTADARVGLGECLLGLGRLDEAEPLLLEGHARLEATEGARGERTRLARALLVALYERSGRPELAERYQEAGGPA